jgi:tRNA (guanine37-N1)-methyltransferase
VVERWVDEELSLGDYVLSSGELATMVMADAIVRLLPGVIKEESYQQDSFYQGRLDHPHYTKPACYRGLEVPEVLLSGHHKRIDAWQAEQSELRTRERRPDLTSPTGGIEEL